ncbi:MAG: bifunctional phosphoribosylaminoimidazolecarboxamide formyltransferase/IMP cyclohydrolase [Rickettsiales bacterium]|nr:bifunctional phosphoribosylaminoimidazolecarboxamide formyltransferase/IMP cyclohydrolase [Rickettsiales bacterium]
MTDTKITRALLSVSDKTGIVELARSLSDKGVEILSTGGTAKLLASEGIAITEVSEHTGFAEMMDGRVKTLHPTIHGGILALRDNDAHLASMKEHNIAPIDLVVVNLYPFEQTVAGNASYEDAIENIDIGGPAMIRAAAKNHAHVAVVIDPEDYDAIADATTNLATRKRLAAKAYARTAAYDSAISRWFAAQGDTESWPPYWVDAKRKQVLRYGENPHQQAAFYERYAAAPGVASAQQLQGKELSYNNINDTDAAFRLVSEFDEPAIALIKHANPCGVAIAQTSVEAFTKALSCDPVSAYGGILAANRVVDAALVEAIGKLFLEVIIAPSISDEAKDMLAAKKNLRILITGSMPDVSEKDWTIKAVSGGYLVQDNDNQVLHESELKTVSKREPRPDELRDMKFAYAVCKHVKSNAIVLVKDGMTIGIGAGQMSRVDSVRLACEKAATAELSTEGTVLASDAFFPFDDNVHHAAKAGVVALIHPGGSIRDEEVIAAADQYDMAMLMTGMRHFNH